MRKSNADDGAAIGLGILGGLAAAGLFYYLYGPRCQRCYSLQPPGATICENCGKAVCR
jgi:hypothetical protein